MDRRALGERLRAARQRKGLTQAELAERTGVALTTIIRVERGQATPKLDTVWTFATRLDVDPKWLAFGDDEKGGQA